MGKKHKSTDEDVANLEENKKHRSDEVMISDCVHNGLPSDAKMKKKHKKRKHGDKKTANEEVETPASIAEDKVISKKKKEKKCITNGKVSCEQDPTADNLKAKKRKLEINNNNNEVIQRADSEVRTSKPKKNKILKENLNDVNSEIILDNHGDECKETVKKKHKHHSENGLEVKKKHKKKKSNIESESLVICNGEREIGSELSDNADIVKIKRKKSKRKENNVIVNQTESSDASPSEKKSKKHKKDKRKEDIGTPEEDEIVEKKAKKSKKKEKQVKKSEEDVKKSEEDVKKPEETKSREERLREIVELSINDLASAKAPEEKLGQWKSADLGDNDRTQKFLRLLGGTKQPAADQQKSRTAVQMKMLSLAMGSSTQESYMNNLEQQFEKARDISVFGVKGGGLGYEPTPGKGHINPVKSRSIKFDD